MHVLITGAGGTVGRFVAGHMLEEGHRVTALGRAPIKELPVACSPYDLSDPAPVLPAADAVVHCALHHEPGKFRGGEGQDPERFWQLNVEGTKALFSAAREAGCRKAVFLSSRAVYGDHRGGEMLLETDNPSPDTLYGKVKLAGENLLADCCDDGFSGTVLRATGVYGLAPGASSHKWSGLFDDFLAGGPVDPGCGTEVHGDDLASAVALTTTYSRETKNLEVFNVSDLVLDRHALLKMLQAACGRGGEPPPTSAALPGTMDTTKLRALGWKPGGVPKLSSFLEACCFSAEV
ncbi:NAD(P)-dependent oxidoreductase [Labrenzia sp. DG1229]|uniref:NAD-dependent epimerase/dehydratase family protein n=1 Tax=Labrenzia sp. DG1229 TaxID=681847 RepID=UPI0004918E65|nr:NAD(P)-dependent oxidoreductase [Labrenzia sp. DG1229]